MKQSSNREKRIQLFQIPSNETWAADQYWNPEINQRIMTWIAEYFIPRHNDALFKPYRNQMAELWHLFQQWLKETDKSFDLREIDIEILIEFGKALPSLEWPSSAVQLVEVVLIKVREYLHNVRLLENPSGLRKNFLREEPAFQISVQEYWTLRQFFLGEGSPHEKLYFELATMNLNLKNGPEIFGKDIIFNRGRAYIARRFSQFQGLIPCSKPVSKQLLLFLRSRDILAEENIFNDSNGEPLVNYSLFKEKAKELCEKRKMPFFVADALYGFQRELMLGLIIRGNYSFDDMEPLIFPENDHDLPNRNLELLDKVYSQLTEQAIYTRDVVGHCHLSRALFLQKRFPEPAKADNLLWYAMPCFGTDSLEAKLKGLRETGCEFIFYDKIKNNRKKLPWLRRPLVFLRTEDMLVMPMLKDFYISLTMRLSEKVTKFYDSKVGLKAILGIIEANGPDGEIEIRLFCALAKSQGEILHKRSMRRPFITIEEYYQILEGVENPIKDNDGEG